MAHSDLPVSQQSQLSVDAESFVPGRLTKGGGPPGPGPGLNPHLHPDNEQFLSPQEISQLPRYLTSCYPFVQGDPGGTNSSRNSSGSWQGPGRPTNANVGGHRMPGPRPANFGHGNGPRPFGPRNMKNQPMHPSHLYANSPGNLQHGQGFLGPHPAGLGSIPPGQQGFNPFAPYLPPHMGIHPQHQGWMAHTPQEYAGGPFPPNMYPQYPGQYPTAGMGEWGTGTERSEKKKKKKAETLSGMVSIGIQNESGVQHNSSSSSKRKNKPKTIICKNAEIQTDFSDEIANLTLAEKPSSLYIKDNRSRAWLQRYQQESSTDSEEKDSDSGYSSPLHRRNQANNGTHPVIGLHYGQTNLIGPPPNTSSLLQQPSGLYPQFMPPNSMTAFGGYSQTANLLANTPNTFTVAPFMQSQYPPRPLLPTQAPPTSIPVHHTNIHSIPEAPGPSASNPSVKHNTNINPWAPGAKTEPEDEETSSGKKKKKKSARQRKKRTSSGDEVGALSDEPYELRRAYSSSNVSRTSTVENDLTLHFDDEDEFPGLLSAVGGLPSSGTQSQCSGVVSYSDILKSHVPSLSQDSSVSSIDRYKYSSAQSGSSTPSEYKAAQAAKETKNARKRRKRRELASRAADEELAEISLEQHVLKELRSKAALKDTNQPSKPEEKTAPQPRTQPAGKKSKQPIALNLSDMISALEKQQEQEKANKKQQQSKAASAAFLDGSVANPLDASAPAKRGKEREVPKVKKPSPLKKVILKEREEKKRLRLLDETPAMSPADDSSNSSSLPPVTGMPLDSDLSQEGEMVDPSISSKASSMELTGTPVSADMSPISQTSPISMSPLSGSPLSSGVNSPIAGNNPVGQCRSSVAMKIHSRRFREYCNQVLDKDIDNSCTALLQDLVRFQDRLYHKDPLKAKSRRRIVLGLREVTKHLKLGKIKLVIISPNLERIQSKGGLDEALYTIIELCSEQDVPFVFALGRRALGRACAKLVPVSVVGIFNYEGTEDNFKNLMDLTEIARSAYKEMVFLLEKELEELPHMARNPGAPTTANVGGFAQLFPHLGHSRTPSACSAISFTSSILSEPISENYPHSEPETDSRGYEIVRDTGKGPVSGGMAGSTELVSPSADQEAEAEDDEAEDEDEDEDRPETPESGKMIIVESLNDIDEGHEADTEEDITVHPRKKASVSVAAATEDCNASHSDKEEDDADDESSCGSTDRDSQVERDQVQDLPHIDSIHSSASAADLSTEILSQHSSKTIDLNVEVMSTHSSKTLEGGRVTPDRSSRNMGSAPDLREASNAAGSGSSSSQRLRSVDNNERIQCWVTETQKHYEKGLSICSNIAEENTTNGDMQTMDKPKTCDLNGEVAITSDIENISLAPDAEKENIVNATDSLIT